jgi:hypothetical protein
LNFPNRSISFKFEVQILIDPKLNFPSSKILENMVVNLSKRGTIISIETSSYSEWDSNEKSEKLLGLEFDRI